MSAAGWVKKALDGPTAEFGCGPRVIYDKDEDWYFVGWRKGGVTCSLASGMTKEFAQVFLDCLDAATEEDG